jgi:regulator of nucleoside diphosphate kinase
VWTSNGIGGAAPAIAIVDVDYEVLVELVRTPGRPGAGLTLLRIELERASIVPASRAPANLVRIGSSVHLVNRVSKRLRRLELALPGETDRPEVVSIASDLGAAMIGLRPGQVFSWRDAGRSRRTIEVLDVKGPIGPRIIRSHVR